MHLCAGRDKRLGARIAARKTKHLVASVNQLRYESRTNETRRTCNKYTHMNSPLLQLWVLRSLLVPRDWNRGALSGYFIEIGKHFSGNLQARCVEIFAKMLE